MLCSQVEGRNTYLCAYAQNIKRLMISIPLLADMLSADSTATSQVTTALGTATQPLELDVNKWFSPEMMNDWLNSGINFGIRVVLVGRGSSGEIELQ